MESLATGSRIDGRSILRMGGARRGLHFLAAAQARISRTARDQLLDGAIIDRHPQRLIDRALVPIEPEPAQVVPRLPVRARLHARPVQILDSEDDPPPLPPRE